MSLRQIASTLQLSNLFFVRDSTKGLGNGCFGESSKATSFSTLTTHKFLPLSDLLLLDLEIFLGSHFLVTVDHLLTSFGTTALTNFSLPNQVLMSRLETLIEVL